MPNRLEAAQSAHHEDLTIRCLFFARYAEILDRSDVEVVMKQGATVADAVEWVRSKLPEGHLLPESPLVAKNQQHSKPDSALADGDELAFLPPLGGG